MARTLLSFINPYFGGLRGKEEEERKGARGRKFKEIIIIKNYDQNLSHMVQVTFIKAT